MHLYAKQQAGFSTAKCVHALHLQVMQACIAAVQPSVMLNSPSFKCINLVKERLPCGSSGSWRKEAKAVLGKMGHLNRSQMQAIATALTRTISLWQV